MLKRNKTLVVGFFAYVYIAGVTAILMKSTEVQTLGELRMRDTS